MKTSALAIILTLAFGGTAVAGGLDATPAAPPVTYTSAPIAGAFDGFYAGLSYGHAAADYLQTPGAQFDLGDGTALGGFLGFNASSGNLVFGGELRYLEFDGLETNFVGFGVTSEVTSVTDLRGRVGYSMGDFMVYGALGLSWSEINFLLGSDASMQGHNVGIGGEFNVTESVFVGVDYTVRALEGNSGVVQNDLDLNTFTLRAGIQF